MSRCGLENVFGEQENRYPEITSDQLKEANPEVIFLSSEPYPFSEKHFEEIEHILPDTSVVLADGEMFSWYGSRILLADSYIKHLHSALLN
jgi:ABC-type Fe3+-hydroxamate transport system substrate-binding protein